MEAVAVFVRQTRLWKPICGQSAATTAPHAVCRLRRDHVGHNGLDSVGTILVSVHTLIALQGLSKVLALLFTLTYTVPHMCKYMCKGVCWSPEA